MDEAEQFDLAVIGTGPAGQSAAIQAAKAGRRVVAVDRHVLVGGQSVLTNTIPSKTLREAVFYLTGIGQRAFYGESYRVMEHITMHDLLERTEHVIREEVDIIKDAMLRNGVEIATGTARFVDANRLAFDDDSPRTIRAGKIIIAVGSEPARPANIPFDARHVFDSDDILKLAEIPKSMVIAGAGVVGCEYASIFAALGTRVTLIDGRRQLLDFVDTEITDALKYHMRDTGITIRLGHDVQNVEFDRSGNPVANLANGAKLAAETFMYSAGRRGATGELNLQAAGLEGDDRGRLVVDEFFRTVIPHIYATGDVIGHPALAATAAEQGRLAARHACGLPVTSSPGNVPVGIYTLPEISMVGKTEEELTREGTPYESGIARFREIARGNIIGDNFGMLKLLFHAHDRRILGVHIFGTQATELIHIGQAVMTLGGTIDYFVDTVFNYPTLAECYKVAGLRGFNKLVQG